MALLPERMQTLNTTMIYRGSLSALPEKGINGEMVYNTTDGRIYTFWNNGWIRVADTVTKSNIIDDLTEVLDKYPDSLIAKDIRTYLELQRMRMYA